jgi:hypothetical protein
MSLITSGPVTVVVTSILPDGTVQVITSLVVIDAPTVLTTFFTPPYDCLSGAWTSNTSAYGALVCTRAYTESCFPPGYSEHQNVVYSPGVCPKGYNPGTMFSDPATPMATSCVCCPQ